MKLVKLFAIATSVLIASGCSMIERGHQLRESNPAAYEKLDANTYLQSYDRADWNQGG